jgi:hypothetical protein
VSKKIVTNCSLQFSKRSSQLKRNQKKKKSKILNKDKEKKNVISEAKSTKDNN